MFDDLCWFVILFRIINNGDCGLLCVVALVV